ncbi:Protein DSF2 [Smittium culicis]|uniref:Protein DSF2 n=1 Tax=Smittium culicis TaxID=133412 RepID=A0A1R1XBM6_9FUNG|nr:Protein DSF2 [Smittium culicis]OMJ18643.1 Protein DSF2 [Smittium culicis]
MFDFLNPFTRKKSNSSGKNSFASKDSSKDFVVHNFSVIPKNSLNRKDSNSNIDKQNSDFTLNNVQTEPEFNDAASYHSINSSTLEYSSFPMYNVSENPSIEPNSSLSRTNVDLLNSDSASFLNQSTKSLATEELPPSFQRQRMENKDKHANSPSTLSPKMSKEEKTKAIKEKSEIYFQQAIKKHEQGDLRSSTIYFKKAADMMHPIGLLFFGLSLRHGWGCDKNEKMSFLYLQKAGELIAPEAKSLNSEIQGPAKKELAMAIYELGQSYYHGWGVPKNRKTAVHYFELSANLGDPDAQVDLASSYENGDGVKRDLKKAAHFYRLAHNQGIDQFGNSWIFKQKYDP